MAQSARATVAPPGDQLDTPGPLATNLSPKLTRPELTKAMKLVADWQLRRLPEKTQYDWTFAALYAGYMGVPDAVAGDKYKQAMMQTADKLQWSPGPRVEHADDQAIGQMYMEQYFIHKDKTMMDPDVRTRLDQEIATPDDPQKPLWWWCDALFMALSCICRHAQRLPATRIISTSWIASGTSQPICSTTRTNTSIRAMPPGSTNTRRMGRRSSGPAVMDG